MRIYTYSILRKGLKPKYYLLCLPVFAFWLWAPQTLLADIGTLKRITKAERTVSYIGVRLNTLISSKGTRTFEEFVIHKSPEFAYAKELSVVGERKSFYRSRDDEHRDENRRDNRRRSDREREHEQNRWRRQTKSLFSEKKIKLIGQNYNLERTPSTEKIANYATDLLTIIPKFAGRYTHRIFFARENGVILRIEKLDSEGVLRAMSIYTRISFDIEAIERRWQEFEKEIKPQPQHSHSISIAEGAKILEIEPIQPGYLPPGFQLEDVHNVKGREKTIHLIYTDGLLGFSIFETTDKRARRSSDRHRSSDVIELDGTSVRRHQRGPTHGFSWSRENIHFFLFGAMPPTEMQKVAESIIEKTKKK